MTAARTQEEIVARGRDIAADDVFGFRTEVLVMALEFEHAREFLVANTTAEMWAALTGRPVDTEAREYYAFALGKMQNHRGISASRSVDKLGEFAWLLGRDDVVDAMAAADYAQYGAPKVRAFAAGFDLEWPDDPALNRMAEGQPCTPGCEEGCGG